LKYVIFGILRSVELHLLTDVSRSLLVPHIQESSIPRRIFSSGYLTFEDGIDRFSRNVWN